MGNKGQVAKVGYFRSHLLVAKGALRDLVQRPLGSMFTLAVIAIILALPASLYVVAKNVVIASEQVNQPAAISAYLKEGTPEARIMLLKDEIESDSAVEMVEYISSQQGLADLSQVSGFESTMSLLDEDALPALLVIHPAQATESAQRHILQLAEQHKSDFTDIRLDKDWLQRFDAVKTLSSALAVSLAVMMLMLWCLSLAIPCALVCLLTSKRFRS
ncbi:cell division protein ftsX [Vibrio ishigakensis]|uniref:Cell division protein ftsX n=1 Tax=Vibrio ishigakensis TaxID=1481914 RepID=A0A0B8QPA8_9VIBR|nr:cell division protein ftsX [Vibrio ishigakensis]